ncbi:amino acid synthesis family protein [Saccharopolyspora sp. NFXS83]|uniref:amino acid synthesis family protein n=1 Tax=Saccharopolyspora sp. NFXS83 TaxID=2993560 RepID=UPI00224B74CD|nr:amino acid synthesis family protein [Saccharopolyspora sp. NFXS83]MCX2729297.1 amino acid synthesis family protein [Saccharopolyspora sp. NFXS83]
MTGPRKVVTTTETLLRELGRPVDCTAHRAAAAAVIPNPWAGRGHVEDLSVEVERIAPGLARTLHRELAAALGGSAEITAFGKAAIVGLDGELEHAAALIHTPYFGNVLRELLDGTSIIVFSDERGPAGTTLTVPIWHKTDSATRSQYQTIPVRIPDAPADDEIVVIAAASTGPRPNARIGDRTTDPVVRLADLEDR